MNQPDYQPELRLPIPELPPNIRACACDKRLLDVEDPSVVVIEGVPHCAECARNEIVVYLAV